MNPPSLQKTQSDAETPLLEVRGLSLSFRKQENAVDRVSFKLSAGQTLGLVGASGAGKSSVARAILRLIEPGEGEVLLDGKNILNMDRQGLKEARRRIQIVFQEPSASLSPRRTIAQTLLEPLQHFGIGQRQSWQTMIRRSLQTVGLDQNVLQRYPHQFSSGQQQRIAIARALVTNPDVLIADEAVSALDVSIQAQILQLMQNLQAEHDIAFLFISHDLAVIRQVADEVAVMYRGQLLEHTTADNFFSRPAHPYSKNLLSFAGFEEPPQQTQEPHAETVKSGCVYATICGDKLPVCGRIEPEYHNIQSNHNLHCVKCHLYDETSNNEK